jgi:hypothetical protein
MPDHQGPPIPLQQRAIRDTELIAKFVPHLTRLCNAFAAQNPDSAHAVMCALMYVASVTGHAIGMREGDWQQFTLLCFRDQGQKS